MTEPTDGGIDRDDFTGIPAATYDDDHEAEVQRLLAEHNPGEWNLRGDQ